MAYSNPPKARSEPRGTGSREGGRRCAISKPFIIEIDIFSECFNMKIGSQGGRVMTIFTYPCA